MPFNIYMIMWYLLHCLISCYEYLLWLRVRIMSFTLRSCNWNPIAVVEQQQREYDFLIKCKKQLIKIPKHLNIIIGYDDKIINEIVIQKILSYALVIGIECISLFNNHQFNTYAVKDSLKWQRKTSKENSSNGSNEKNVNPSIQLGNNFNEHIETSPKMYEIKSEDNRRIVVEVCRKLFKQKDSLDIQQILQNRSILMEHINCELDSTFNHISEPELSIIFSANMCTYGVLPWHTRFTEFLRYESKSNFSVETFTSLLYKYSKCEQRYGK